jgi:radical SAM protein with 4Fe4S-binding SPASM domain
MIDILRNGTSCESCYAGCKTLTISVDGDYYPCHRFVNNSKYKIGSVCSGLDVDKLELYKQNIVDNKVKCKICSVRKFCGGTCIYEVLSNDGDLKSYINIVECAFRKTLYLEVIKILLLNNNTTENEVSKSLSKGSLKIKNSIFAKSKDTNKIDFTNNGIIYKNTSLWYSGNITSMAIWELIDGKRKAIKIAKEIADACEVKPNDIQEEIYQQLRSFQELGFIEEVQKESVVLN